MAQIVAEGRLGRAVRAALGRTGLQIACSLLLCAGSLASSPVPTDGQEGGDGKPIRSSTSSVLKEDLRGRDRELMHPGSPLRIRGIGQGENDFRGRTPALVTGEQPATLLREDENYRRRLAMYTDGARFRSAPRAEAVEPKISPAVLPPIEVPTGTLESSSRMWFILAGVATVILAVLLRSQAGIVELLSGKRPL